MIREHSRIILIIVVLLLFFYIGTGRYAQVIPNIKEKGVIGLLDEPFFVLGWIGEKIGTAAGAIKDFLDQKHLGRKI